MAQAENGELKTAIVHDWLTGMRGGERVLEIMCSLYPDADIYTLFHIKNSVSSTIERRPIHTSFLQKFPFIKTHYRYLLPLFPLAVESFCLDSYDLVISLSHCAALGVITRPETCHVCYCFTPMRYIRDQFDCYFNRKNSRLKKGLISIPIHFLRIWDQTASCRVDRFIATSRHIVSRIKKYYRRSSEIIHPPVNTDFFQPSAEKREDFYLIVSALSPYKKIDLATAAFNESGKPLVIIGWGPEIEHLKKSAKKNIRFLGKQSDETLLNHYRRCKALVFPGEEDFGLTPLEAQACGTPVIAYEKGGVIESVIPDATGVFFNDSSPNSLNSAIQRFEKMEFNPELIRNHALKFSIKEFRLQMRNMVDLMHKQHVKSMNEPEKGLPGFSCTVD